MTLLFAGIFVICLLAGMPIVFTLAIPGFVYILIQDVPLVMVPQRMFAGADVYVLIALPMFIIAGNLMNAAGISKRLISFSMACVGFFPGGLAMVNVLASMFFGGVTGSGTAEAAAMGSIMVPAMKKQGYPDGFSAALTTVASTCGPIIPPSILFIIYGFLAHVSIGRLFLAGFIPGVLIAVSLMLTVYYLAKKNNYPRGEPFSIRKIFIEFKNAILALILPFIIVGGMISGILTPTEVSVLAVFLAVLIGRFIYKELEWKDIPKIVIDSAILSGSILLIIATNNILIYAITLEQVAEKIGIFILSVTNNKFLILLLINFILLILGAVIDNLPLMIMFIPIITPIFKLLSVDPVHAGVFVVLNITIAMSTPPVGTSLFILASIAKTDLYTVCRYIAPFLLAVFIVLMMITYFPFITLVIPNMFFD